MKKNVGPEFLTTKTRLLFEVKKTILKSPAHICSWDLKQDPIGEILVQDCSLDTPK